MLAACNKQAISDLQARIDTLEKVTLANVQSQIATVRSALSALDGAQKELSACVSELQNSDASLKEITTALLAQQEGFGAELEALRKSVKDNAEDVRKWMDSAGKTLQEMQENMAEIREQIAAVVSSVQSVVVVPDFKDGSVEIRNLQANRLFFEIYPLSAAELLARLGASAVSLDAVETSTRAGEKRTVNFPVSETAFDGTFFTVVADCSAVVDLFITA